MQEIREAFHSHGKYIRIYVKKNYYNDHYNNNEKYNIYSQKKNQ